MPRSTALPIELSDGERRDLESWTRRRTSAHALRSQIVLAAAEGLKNAEISQRLGVSRPTVTKWRTRFASERLEGLLDDPRPGRPRTVSDEQVEQVVVRTLESPPKDAPHWTTRSMAAEVGLTQSAVHRIWRAFGLQPHRDDLRARAEDTEIRDVVGLYLDPPERAVVLCFDDTSAIQAPATPIAPLLARDGERATLDRTPSLSAALDVDGAPVGGSRRARNRAIEFRKFLAAIDREVPDDRRVHLILDNASTHKTPAVRNWLHAHSRFVVHLTPTSSSWRALVERWFAQLAPEAPRRTRQRSVGRLNSDIRSWIATWHANPRPFAWTMTAEDLLE